MHEKAYHINRRINIIRCIVTQSCSVSRNKPQSRQQEIEPRLFGGKPRITIKMVLRKYDTANSEQFVIPIHGLYPEHVISIEDFKDHNVDLMKNC